MGLGREVVVPAVIMGSLGATTAWLWNDSRKDQARLEERVTEPFRNLTNALDRRVYIKSDEATLNGLGKGLYDLVSTHSTSDKPHLTLEDLLKRKQDQNVPGGYEKVYLLDFGVGKESGDRSEIARKNIHHLQLSVDGDTLSLSRSLYPRKGPFNKDGTPKDPSSYDEVKLVKRQDDSFGIVSARGKVVKEGLKSGYTFDYPTVGTASNQRDFRESIAALVRIADATRDLYGKQILKQKV